MGNGKEYQASQRNTRKEKGEGPKYKGACLLAPVVVVVVVVVVCFPKRDIDFEKKKKVSFSVSRDHIRRIPFG